MFTPRFTLLAAVALVAAAAQQPQNAGDSQEPATIKVNVDVVNILCSVRNKQGGLVGNLNKDDFQLSEEGKPQTIRYFTRETDLPLTMGLLIDVSGSQARLIDIEKEAAGQFFSQVLRPKDLAFLISFGPDAELLQDYTNSSKLLRKGLEDLHVEAPPVQLHPGPVPTIYQPRGTVLYDAVYLAAAEQLKGQVGRKALVLITDGVDEGSRLKIQDALAAAQKADAIIYSIDYSDPSAYGFGGFGGFGGVTLGPGLGDSALKKLSEETGGRVFKVDRKHPLTEVFKEHPGGIADAVRNRLRSGQPRQGRRLPPDRSQDHAEGSQSASAQGILRRTGERGKRIVERAALGQQLQGAVIGTAAFSLERRRQLSLHQNLCGIGHSQPAARFCQ